MLRLSCLHVGKGFGLGGLAWALGLTVSFSSGSLDTRNRLSFRMHMKVHRPPEVVQARLPGALGPRAKVQEAYFMYVCMYVCMCVYPYVYIPLDKTNEAPESPKALRSQTPSVPFTSQGGWAWCVKGRPTLELSGIAGLEKAVVEVQSLPVQ